MALPGPSEQFEFVARKRLRFGSGGRLVLGFFLFLQLVQLSSQRGATRFNRSYEFDSLNDRA